MDNWIDQAIYNSYQVLTGWFTMEELVDYLEMRREEDEEPSLSTMPVFFIPPGEEADNEDLDAMISHFEELECYEECAELLKLKK